MARGISKPLEERKMVVSFSIPYSTFVALEEEAFKQGMNRSQYLCEVLGKHFNSEHKEG